MNRKCQFLIFVLKTLALLISTSAVVRDTYLFSLHMNINNRAKQEFSNYFIFLVSTHSF